MLLDHQLGVANETTYGTAVTPARFFEYDTESLQEDFRRTESNALRAGMFLPHKDRFVPYQGGVAGNIGMEVLTSGFGFWLEHMLGSVATSGVGPFTHTATMAEIGLDAAFTAQVNRPFNPTGGVNAITCSGGKITEWTLSNSVEAHLMAEFGVDFQASTTATALATASYPTGVPLTWVGGTITVDGTQFDATEFSVQCSNGLNVDRRYIRGNALKKAPTGSQREVSFSLNGDYDSNTRRDIVAASAAGDTYVEVEGVWASGTSSLTVTVKNARFDQQTANADGPNPISQALSGIALQEPGVSPVDVVYVTADTTP